MRPSSDLPRRRVAVPGRRLRSVALILVVLSVVGVVVARWLARLVTDGWWFDVLQQRPVLSTINRARFELGLVGGLAAALTLYACLLVVDRTPPLERGFAPDDQLVTRYQVLVAEHGLALRLLVSGVFGLIAGLPMASRWQEWLLFRNAVSFSVDDGVYHHDIGFYVFRLPFLVQAVEWVFTVVVVATLISAAAHYLSGSVRLAGPGKASSAVRVHLSLLLVLLALLRAGAYWLRRLELVTSDRGYVRGVGYTDRNHVQPALALLVLVALTTAVLLVVGLRQRSWRLPMVATALWAVVALMTTAVYPAIVQRLVASDEVAVREASAIRRNVAATRAAFGLDDAELTTPDRLDPTPEVVSADDLANLGDVRLLSAGAAERNLSLPTASAPDAGLYMAEGGARQIYVGIPSIDPGDRVPWEQRHRREISASQPVLLEASRVAADGGTVAPASEGVLDVRGGPIFVAEEVDSFAVVSPATVPRPAAALATVPMSSFARRMAFALRFADLDLVQRTDNADRILYVRAVGDRVRTLAPFLQWDSDPYAIVADSRVQWVIDGYTTTDAYPEAERADVSGLPLDSGLPRSFNYVRNSVKAVVDAHEGRVTLYVTDESDPILTAWRTAFPTLFQSWDNLSSQVKAQLRYPNDLLRVQAAMWGRYRTDDARPDGAAFFVAEAGRWTTAPTRVVGTPQLSAATTTTTGERVTTTTVAEGGTSVRSTVMEPLTVVWGGRLVSVTAMVDAARPTTEDDLAALITGTVHVDGQPLLRVLRADGAVPSPGAARARLEEAARSYVSELDAETGFGELQPVSVGTTMAWVLPWYQAAGTQVAGVAMMTAAGKVAVAESVEQAARELYRAEPTFRTREPGSSSPTPSLGDKTADELWDEVRELRRQAEDRLAANDLPGAVELFERALDVADRARIAERAEAAAQADPPTDPPATTSTTAAGTTSPLPTVNA